jgi:transposase
MIPVQSGVRLWLATGHTDMRKGFASLSLQVQEVLRRDPLSGQLFCFRGRRGDITAPIGIRRGCVWSCGRGTAYIAGSASRTKNSPLAGHATAPSTTGAGGIAVPETRSRSISAGRIRAAA